MPYFLGSSIGGYRPLFFTFQKPKCANSSVFSSSPNFTPAIACGTLISCRIHIGYFQVIVADTENHCLRSILVISNAQVSTLAGQPTKPGYAEGGAAAAQFNGPSAVAVDPLQVPYVPQIFFLDIFQIFLKNFSRYFSRYFSHTTRLSCIATHCTSLSRALWS